MNLLLALFTAIAVICTLIHEAAAETGETGRPHPAGRLIITEELPAADNLDAALGCL
jgi:hypothetical protein